MVIFAYNEFIFYVMKKVTPSLPATPTKSWGPVKPPLFKNLVVGSASPPSINGGGAHYAYVTRLSTVSCLVELDPWIFFLEECFPLTERLRVNRHPSPLGSPWSAFLYGFYLCLLFLVTPFLWRFLESIQIKKKAKYMLIRRRFF